MIKYNMKRKLTYLRAVRMHSRSKIDIRAITIIIMIMRGIYIKLYYFIVCEPRGLSGVIGIGRLRSDPFSHRV